MPGCREPYAFRGVRAMLAARLPRESNSHLRTATHPIDQRLARDAKVCRVLQDLRDRGGQSEVTEHRIDRVSVHASVVQSLYHVIARDYWISVV
jgi:hypothetical protein